MVSDSICINYEHFGRNNSEVIDHNPSNHRPQINEMKG